MKKPDLPDHFRPDVHFFPLNGLFPRWFSPDLSSRLAGSSFSEQFLFGEIRFNREITFQSGKATLPDPVFSSGLALSEDSTSDELILPFSNESISSLLNLRSSVYKPNSGGLKYHQVKAGPGLPVDPAGIIEMLYRCNDWIRQQSKGILDVAFQVQCEQRVVLGIGSESPGFLREEFYSDWMCTVYLKKKGRIFTGSSRLGEFDFERGFQLSDPFQSVLTALKKAELASLSRPLEYEFYDILLQPGWGMMFFHEIIGHAFEADNEDEPFYSIRNQVGSDLLTVADDGLIAGGRGTLGFDDEGTPASKTVLIEKGRVKSLLADKKIARQMGIPPTGNGRRAGFNSSLQTRMTNTIVIPGDAARSRLLNQIREGIEVTDSGNGIVNSETGDFKFEILHGYLIKNGTRQHPVYNLQITGKIQDALEKVVGVGNDFYLESSTGYCDKKGQRVPVSVGGPSVLLEKLRVIGLPA